MFFQIYYIEQPINVKYLYEFIHLTEIHYNLTVDLFRTV
jgi:hypothetical protein